MYYASEPLSILAFWYLASMRSIMRVYVMAISAVRPAGRPAGRPAVHIFSWENVQVSWEKFQVSWEIVKVSLEILKEGWKLVEVKISLKNVKVFEKSSDILKHTTISCSFLRYPHGNFVRIPLTIFFLAAIFFGKHAKHNASLCNGDFGRPSGRPHFSWENVKVSWEKFKFPEKLLKFL